MATIIIGFFFQCNHNYYLWPHVIRRVKYLNTFTVEIIQL